MCDFAKDTRQKCKKYLVRGQSTGAWLGLVTGELKAFPISVLGYNYVAILYAAVYLRDVRFWRDGPILVPSGSGSATEAPMDRSRWLRVIGRTAAPVLCRKGRILCGPLFGRRGVSSNSSMLRPLAQRRNRDGLAVLTRSPIESSPRYHFGSFFTGKEFFFRRSDALSGLGSEMEQ